MKILIDMSDELYDTINNSSHARSYGKHLVDNLIDCIVAGTVVDEKQSDSELFESICEKYGIKPNNDGHGLRIVMEDGQVKPLTEELIHEIFPFDIPFVTGLSTDPDNPVPKSKTWNDCSNCEHESEKDGSNCYKCVKGIENRYSPKETIEIKYGEKNLIKGNCAHCSDSVDYTCAGCEVLYACPLPKCKFEEDNKITGE